MSRNEIAATAIVVMGVSGVGKSTVGALLAAQLGCAFLEGDSFHAPASIEMMRSGQALTDIERWPWLDRIGAALAAEVRSRNIAVVACSALKRAYRSRIAESVPAPVRFVFLDDDPDELRRRLAQRPGHYMPPSLLASQFATLERPGPDEAALALRTQASPDFLVREILDWLARPIAAPQLQRSHS